MKLDFNFQFKDLDKKELLGDGGHAGKILANMLCGSNRSQSAMLYSWAVKLWDKQLIEIDQSQLEILKEIIDKTEILTVTAKAQLLGSIEDQIKK